MIKSKALEKVIKNNLINQELFFNNLDGINNEVVSTMKRVTIQTSENK